MEVNRERKIESNDDHDVTPQVFCIWLGENQAQYVNCSYGIYCYVTSLSAVWTFCLECFNKLHKTVNIFHVAEKFEVRTCNGVLL